MRKCFLALAAALLFVIVPAAQAGFESLAIDGSSTPTVLIDVKKNETIEIHNFIDTNTSSVSTIDVTIGTVTARVLSATPSTTSETFKHLVVNGPATITVTVGSTQFSYLTYKGKD